MTSAFLYVATGRAYCQLCGDKIEKGQQCIKAPSWGQLHFNTKKMCKKINA